LTCLPMIPSNFEQRILFAKSGFEIILQLEKWKSKL